MPHQKEISPVQSWLPLLREALAREGRFRWQVEGHSMMPTLPQGCEIEIVPLTGRPRLGDVVVFVEGDSLVVHRLVHRARGFWITQGDARATPDRHLDTASLLGRVVTAYHDGKLCWTSRSGGLVAIRWLSRYHVLRLRRVVSRLITRLRS